jgi:hypothetical protein
MESAGSYELTEAEKERIAKLLAAIEEHGAAGGPWPATYGPAGRQDQQVFEVVARDARAAGWDATFDHDGFLRVVGAL